MRLQLIVATFEALRLSTYSMNSTWTLLLILPWMTAVAHAQLREPIRAAGRLADCADIVDEVLGKTNGRLLSFRSDEKKCIITILQTREGKRPEKIVLEFDRQDAVRYEK
ncbi:hypothetical protein G6M50_09915 [Agrobacterium rhizogenes]|nr:hypothetical protein [Rhizobium rhizogenes]NTJ78108.1 hypothetical protein [Rhizobium rhizogenes]